MRRTRPLLTVVALALACAPPEPEPPADRWSVGTEAVLTLEASPFSLVLEAG